MSSLKAERHRLILSIIAQQPIETQEELVAALRARNLHVTQATVSRDIKELRLAKVAMPNGRYRYALPGSVGDGDEDPMRRLQRAFEEYVHEVDASGNLIVVKTEPGCAPLVAAAIDGLKLGEIIGTIAGDDTILVVVRDNDENKVREGPVAGVYTRLNALLRRRTE